MRLRHSIIFCFLWVTIKIVSAGAVTAAELTLENRSPALHELETIVVTAKRIPSDKKQTAENVVVYTAEDIRKLPARDFGELMQYIPGVDVQIVNKFGQATSISIQGSPSRQVLVMIDDIPFNTQLSGQMNPTLIPVENIKRIEVIKGGASSAWGSSLGGVINVITKDVGDSVVPKGKFTSTFAEFSTTKNSLDLSGRIADWGYYLFGSYLETDGIRPGANVEESKIFGKFSHPLGEEAKVTASFGYTGIDARDKFNDPLFLTTRITQPNYARYGKIRLDVDKGPLTLNAAVKYNNQDIKTQQEFLDFKTSTLTVSANTYYGLSLNGSYVLREGDLLAFGSDFDWHVFKSSSFITESKSLRTQAPYANYTLNLDQWNIIPGIRYDHNEHFGSQFSPSLGLVYDFDHVEDTRFRFKIARAFNAPPLLWIFNESGTIAPNPGLNPERGVVYEAGVETGIFSDFDLDLNVYFAEIEDAIATVTLDSGKSQKQNFDRFRRRGAEMTLNYKMNENLTLFGGGAFNDVENKATDKIVRDQGISRQNFRLGANYKDDQGFGFNLIGYYDRRHVNVLAQPNDRKFILDLKLTKEFKNGKSGIDTETFLNIYNLTNSKYWSSITFPLPKRYFEGGFSVKF